MAEWSCSGLQSRVRRFDSDPSLHKDYSPLTIGSGPGGGTGRRYGLKIRWPERAVPVQFRPRAPSSAMVSVGFRGFRERASEAVGCSQGAVTAIFICGGKPGHQCLDRACWGRHSPVAAIVSMAGGGAPGQGTAPLHGRCRGAGSRCKLRKLECELDLEHGSNG